MIARYSAVDHDILRLNVDHDDDVEDEDEDVEVSQYFGQENNEHVRLLGSGSSSNSSREFYARRSRLEG